MTAPPFGSDAFNEGSVKSVPTSYLRSSSSNSVPPGYDPPDQRFLRVLQRAAVGVGHATAPPAVGVEFERAGLLAHAQGQQPFESFAGGAIGDPHQRLDPAVEVAVHEIGRADPPLGVRIVGGAGAEPEHPGVFEEP